MSAPSPAAPRSLHDLSSEELLTLVAKYKAALSSLKEKNVELAQQLQLQKASSSSSNSDPSLPNPPVIDPKAALEADLAKYKSAMAKALVNLKEQKSLIEQQKEELDKLKANFPSGAVSNSVQVVVDALRDAASDVDGGGSPTVPNSILVDLENRLNETTKDRDETKKNLGKGKILFFPCLKQRTFLVYLTYPLFLKQP